LKAAGVVGLMSTYPALLDRHVATHTWMFFPSGWARFGDWPDIAASRAPAPLLVQYDTEDELFTLQGMQAAHQKLLEHYTHAGDLHAYTGQFYPGAHKFDVEMQESAFQWLEKCLKCG
jgi:predicted esterase